MSANQTPVFIDRLLTAFKLKAEAKLANDIVNIYTCSNMNVVLGIVICLSPAKMSPVLN